VGDIRGMVGLKITDIMGMKIWRIKVNVKSSWEMDFKQSLVDRVLVFPFCGAGKLWYGLCWGGIEHGAVGVNLACAGWCKVVGLGGPYFKRTYEIRVLRQDRWIKTAGVMLHELIHLFIFMLPVPHKIRVSLSGLLDYQIRFK
jgi:hypothetical protein